VSDVLTDSDETEIVNASSVLAPSPEAALVVPKGRTAGQWTFFAAAALRRYPGLVVRRPDAYQDQ